MLTRYNTYTKNGQLFFDTSKGITYNFSFTLVEEFKTKALLNKAFYFSFTPINSNQKIIRQRDSKIGNTIVEIIEQFVEKDNRVILYVPDISDGRQKKRNNLFNRLYEQYEGKDSFTKVDFEYCNEDNECYFASMLVKNSNPLKDLFIKEFNDYVIGLNDK